MKPASPAFVVSVLAMPGLAVGAAGAPKRPHADCIEHAAAHHGVNGHVLRAIGWHESRLRPQALARNRNGTWDIGAFQINSLHLRALARHGIDARALGDGCISAFVAAWHYGQQVARFGNTWRAVGAYHSHTPARSAWYANAIAEILMGWGTGPRGPVPFHPATTLAPRQAPPPRPPRGPPAVDDHPAGAAPGQPPVTLFDEGGADAAAPFTDPVSGPP